MPRIERWFAASGREKHVTVGPFKAYKPEAQCPFFLRLMFWSTDDNLYNVDELNQQSSERRDLAIKRGRPAEDIALLDAAHSHV